MGWAARVVSHYCLYNRDVFTMQLTVLILCESSTSSRILARANSTTQHRASSVQASITSSDPLSRDTRA
jgi:hypothetical protein